MKEIIKYGFILSFICIIASGLLAGVNSLTKSKIISQAQAAEEASLREALPGAARFEAIKSGDETIFYKAFDKDGNFLGVAFKASAKGYSSTIETISGMLKDGTLTVVKVLSQNETPGLGTKVSEGDFLSQFTNKKDLSGVEAITGATISSSAVIKSVTQKAKEVRELLK